MPESLGGGETSFKYGMSDFFKQSKIIMINVMEKVDVIFRELIT